MLLEIFLAVLLVGILVGAYFLYFKPKRALQWYKKTLEELGYKVKMLPFKFLGMPHIDKFFENEKKNLDPLYHYKNEFTSYDIILYNIMSTPIIQLCNPELLKHLFQPENVYIHHKMGIMIQNIQRSLGFGIAFSEGKQWKRKRLIMNAVFNYDFIIQNIEKITRICDENIKIFEEDLKIKGKFEEKDGKRIIKMGILQLFSSIFSNVTLQCFFGIQSSHERIKGQYISTFLNRLNTDITYQGFELPILLFGSKFAELGLRQKDRKINEQVKILRGLAQDFVNKRLKELEQKGPNENYKDIIEALMLKKNLSTQKKSQKDKISKKDAQNYDFAELIEEFCTFFTAGTDTTSHFTQMMIYYISKNPKVQKKLREEIDLYIKTDKDFTKQNLKKLTYIDWIQNQTTRMYGPGVGIFTRIAQKDHYIFNIPIQKGMGINIQPTAFHYNEKYYKNPHQFRPQRWESECNNNHGFALTGFGGGARSCIGKHLAMLQNKIALVKFMRRYKQYRLPKQNFAMHTKFLQEPEHMQIQLVLND